VGTLVWVRWLGESVNTLLPVAQVGGEVVRARLLALRGMAATDAGASVVADMTIGLLTQVVFTVMGLAALAALLGGNDLVWPLAGGIVVMTMLAIGFYAAQRRGLFARVAVRLEAAIGPNRLVPADGARRLDAAVQAVYRRPTVVWRAALWRLVGWLMGAGEIWLAMHFMGVPMGPAEALALESLGQALRGLAFVVPAALGIQEGGLVLVGGLLGLSPESALALALIKRVREITLGIPGLVVWQAIEGRRGWRRLRGLADERDG